MSHCSGIKTSNLGVALRIQNARNVTREGNHLLFRMSDGIARELLETLKVLLPDHVTVTPPGVYYPLLGCDRCEKPTRHLFSRAENRVYKTMDEPTDLSPWERAERDKMNSMLLDIYRCGVCGHERGWGSSGV